MEDWGKYPESRRSGAEQKIADKCWQGAWWRSQDLQKTKRATQNSGQAKKGNSQSSWANIKVVKSFFEEAPGVLQRGFPCSLKDKGPIVASTVHGNQSLTKSDSAITNRVTTTTTAKATTFCNQQVTKAPPCAQRQESAGYLQSSLDCWV